MNRAPRLGTVTAELFHLTDLNTIERLQGGIPQFIHYYNHERIRRKLERLAPVQYRTETLPARRY
ncbi:IS3 family transposase [Paraburkholderia sp. DGU8]|uniref:IS3 family transposase n=1 Tax=Paraburkholderia sp. DGU8 TaxID=3161997 RepID=UPI003467A6AE